LASGLHEQSSTGARHPGSCWTRRTCKPGDNRVLGNGGMPRAAFRRKRRALLELTTAPAAHGRSGATTCAPASRPRPRARCRVLRRLASRMLRRRVHAAPSARARLQRDRANLSSVGAADVLIGTCPDRDGAIHARHVDCPTTWASVCAAYVTARGSRRGMRQVIAPRRDLRKPRPRRTIARRKPSHRKRSRARRSLE
jgi:hypothetical protein